MPSELLEPFKKPQSNLQTLGSSLRTPQNYLRPTGTPLRIFFLFKKTLEHPQEVLTPFTTLVCNQWKLLKNSRNTLRAARSGSGTSLRTQKGLQKPLEEPQEPA